MPFSRLRPITHLEMLLNSSRRIRCEPRPHLVKKKKKRPSSLSARATTFIRFRCSLFAITSGKKIHACSKPRRERMRREGFVAWGYVDAVLAATAYTLGEE